MGYLMKDDFKYYLDNQDDLVERYDGKYLIIKNRQVLKAYDSEEEALVETMKEHQLGTFMIQRCSPGSKDYSAHLLSVWRR